MVQETANASATLADQVSQLSELVRSFKLGGMEQGGRRDHRRAA
jgi:hypothetical protein